MSDNTKFMWTDDTADEILLTTIDDNFTSKYGRQKTDLKEVIIGDKVKTITTNAFKLCKNLENIEMSSHVEKIGAFAFAWCEKLEHINLPDGLENISISAFTFCTNLKKIVIPDSVTLIDDEAFSYCTSLEEVTLPKNLNCIYVSAFINCKSLTEIKIPASTEIIESLAFANCDSLKTVEFEDGALLKEISSGAFSNCYQMTLINQEALANLKNLGDRAFEVCSSITSFKLPEGLNHIGANAFKDCYSLSGEIKFPSTLKTLANEVFTNCIGIESAAFIPREKYIVKAGLFAGCENLKKITGLNNAVEIQTCAFMGCTALEEITLGAGLKTIGDWAFKGCLSLDLKVPEAVTSIGTDAFAYINSIEYKGSAEGFPWGSAETDPLNIKTQQYYNTTGRTVPDEYQLQLLAFDLAWYLQYLHKHKLINDKIFEKYETGILKYVRGGDNEYILANMLTGFDDLYGTENFPLNADVEKFRDRMYIFSKELV